MKISIGWMLAFAASVLASPVPEDLDLLEDFNITATAEALQARGIKTGQGVHGGYFYSFWTDGKGNVDFNNLNGGQYSVTWSGNGNWVGGKGWKPGSARLVPPCALSRRPLSLSTHSCAGLTNAKYSAQHHQLQRHLPAQR